MDVAKQGKSEMLGFCHSCQHPITKDESVLKALKCVCNFPQTLLMLLLIAYSSMPIIFVVQNAIKLFQPDSRS